MRRKSIACATLSLCISELLNDHNFGSPLVALVFMILKPWDSPMTKSSIILKYSSRSFARSLQSSLFNLRCVMCLHNFFVIKVGQENHTFDAFLDGFCLPTGASGAGLSAFFVGWVCVDEVPELPVTSSC